MFTGDRSGDWIYAALHRAGYASQPTSVASGDGLELTRRAHRRRRAVRAAGEQADAAGARDLRALARPRPGARGADRPRRCSPSAASAGTPRWRSARRLGWAVPRPKPRFGHGAETVLVTSDGKPIRLLASYHVSQQNTFTGKLTEAMLDAVIARL